MYVALQLGSEPDPIRPFERFLVYDWELYRTRPRFRTEEMARERERQARTGQW